MVLYVGYKTPIQDGLMNFVKLFVAPNLEIINFGRH